MVTKRTPVRPPPGKGISPAAIETFRKMEQAGRFSEKWHELDSVLRREMRLPPWEYPTYLEYPETWGDGNPDAVARYATLKAASEAAA